MRIFSGILAFALYGNDLPELPRLDTSRFLPAIRAQIESAWDQAKAHPRDARAAGALAMTLHAYQQYDTATRVYSRAHLLEPNNFEWVYLAGAAEMAQGRFDTAAELFQLALRIQPENPMAELRLADSMAARANWDEAGTLYNRIVDQHPACAQAWYGLGRVHAAKREHTAAVQCYSKACELFPAFGMAHFALAGEFRRLGDQAQANQHLAAYSKNTTAEPPLDDPSFKRIYELNLGVQARLQRAAELAKAGRLEEAIEESEAALRVDPKNVQVYVNLISLYGRKRDVVKARQSFDEAVALNPGRSDAWYNLGVLLFELQNYADAEKAFGRALEINPDYAEARNNLGAIHEQQGRLEDAAKEFRESIAARPDYPLARYHLGRILVAEQKYDEAIQQFLRALTPEDDQTTVYLYALAATYARAGDLAHALAWFQKARDAAIAHGQSQLLTSIDRDLKALGGGR